MLTDSSAAFPTLPLAGHTKFKFTKPIPQTANCAVHVGLDARTHTLTFTRLHSHAYIHTLTFTHSPAYIHTHSHAYTGRSSPWHHSRVLWGRGRGGEGGPEIQQFGRGLCVFGGQGGGFHHHLNLHHDHPHPPPFRPTSPTCPYPPTPAPTSSTQLSQLSYSGTVLLLLLLLLLLLMLLLLVQLAVA